MTTPTHTDVTITAPGDLVAALPYLLGFHPVDSLIVLGQRGTGTELGLALRVDLPPPPGRASEVAEQLVVPLVQQSTGAVTLIAIGHGDLTAGRDDDPPYRDVLDTFTAVFTEAGLPVAHRLWSPATAEGARWRCYDEPGCDGVTPDPASTPMAAAAVVAGAVTYQRREDIAATLTPDDDETLARRAVLLRRASETTEPGSESGSESGTEHWTRSAQRFATVLAAVSRAGCRLKVELTDEDVVALIGALSDRYVREACLRFDDLEDEAAAQRLWTALVRATPAPERADPACLLAITAYLRGNGVLAGLALDVAEKAHPGHVLAMLLRSALVTGMPPEQLEEVTIRAAKAARPLFAEEPR
jgi:hypothetical protein